MPPVRLMVGPVGEYVPTTNLYQAGEVTGPRSGRVGASVTALPDGRVVLIGGASLKTGLVDPTGRWATPSALGDLLDTVEIFDPSRGSFEALSLDATNAQTLYYPRAFHAAVYLPRHRWIAVVGGYEQAGPGAPIQESYHIEVFDPESKQFLDRSLVGDLGFPRVHAAAVALDYGDL